MIAPVFAAAAAFNLVCSIAFTSGDLSKSLAPGATSPIPSKRVYHIDLDAGRYCTEPCASTNALYAVSPKQIVFKAEERGDLDDTLEVVDRETGELLDRLRMFPMVLMYTGKCEAGPFTGLPAPKF